MSAPSSAGIAYTEAQRLEAAEWFVIIHAEEAPSSETLQAWLRWMDEQEGNRVAFESVAEVWHGTPGSTALAMPSVEELQSDTYEGDQPVGDWLASQSAAVGRRQRAGKSALQRANRRRQWAWLAAASLVVVTVGLLTMNSISSPRELQSDRFTTRIGEQLEMTLADGSRVWLGPGSALLVGFTSDRRGIELKTGEAYFSVRKDRDRPFVVRSAGGDITAVGTAFNVRAVTDQVTVSVSEGVVAVAPIRALAIVKPAEVRVASGQQLTFTAEEPIETLAITLSPAVGERARWRDGILVYRDEPLRDVVMDVARYSGRQLEISGDGIGNLRYTGVVYQDAVDEWASALPESFPVRIVTEGNREIIVAR